MYVENFKSYVIVFIRNVTMFLTFTIIFRIRVSVLIQKISPAKIKRKMLILTINEITK
jgi:hypothetical protein